MNRKAILKLNLVQGRFYNQSLSLRPYVVLSLGSQSYKSPVALGPNPTWNSNFEFELDPESFVSYKIYNKYSYKKDKLLAQSAIDLTSLKKLQTVKEKYVTKTPEEKMCELSIELKILPLKLLPSDVILDLYEEDLIYSNAKTCEESYCASIPSSGQRVYVNMISFKNSEGLEAYYQRFKGYNKLKDAGVIDIYDIRSVAEGEYYSVIWIFKRDPGVFLADEITNRKLKNDYWTEIQLNSMFSRLIKIFSGFERCQMYHGAIFPISFNYSDGLSLNNIGIQLKCLNDYISDCKLNFPEHKIPYFSPELLRLYISMQKNEALVNINYYKSDVYSLGLVFLHMASLKAPAGLNDTESALESRIEEALSTIQYSENIKILIKLMLTIQESSRPTFFELEENFKL
jgi:C2 domain